MDLITLLIALVVFGFWGIGVFLGKLAAQRIGPQGAFWDFVIGCTPVILIYSLIVFKFKNLIQGDRLGIFLAILAGAIGSIGSVGLYVLLSRSEASTVVPLTALYPAVVVILGIILLQESLTLTKLAGIIFSLIAIYLLSK